MASARREAEWALARARRLMHDAMVEMGAVIRDFRIDMKLGNEDIPLSKEAYEFFKPPYLKELIAKREAELDWEIMLEEDNLHTAILDGAL
jgi:hypothetical protein